MPSQDHCVRESDRDRRSDQTGTLRADKPNSFSKLTTVTVRSRLTVRNGPLIEGRGDVDRERRAASWRPFLADTDIRTVPALTS